jgi:MFS family permease
MKPTAYGMFCLSVVLVIMAALLYQFPNPSTSGNEGMHAGQWTLSVLMLAGAIGAVAMGWVMLRFGGKGYTVTNWPPARR